MSMTDLIQLINEMERKYKSQLIATGRIRAPTRPHAEPDIDDVIETVDPWYTQDEHLYAPRL